MKPISKNSNILITIVVAIMAGLGGGLLGNVITQKYGILVEYNLPVLTSSIDSVLGIPVVVYHPNNAILNPYSPTWQGLQIRYVGDIFSGLNRDMLYVPETKDGKVLLPWHESENGSPGLQEIHPGDTFTVVNNRIYDLGLGPLFAKVQLENKDLEGFVPLSLVIGETDIAGDDFWAAEDAKRLISSSTVTYNGIRLYAIQLPSDKKRIAEEIEIIGDPSRYGELSAGQPGAHPLNAASTLLTVLFIAARESTPEVERQHMLNASEVFFDEYVIPRQDIQDNGSVSWPYEFEWTTNWGVRLVPPWYSTMATAAFANAAALMYSMTGDDKYREIAENAIHYIGTTNRDGGGEYNASGFRTPADFIYDFSHTPNIRVLDGEMATIIYSYNTARLLGSWDAFDISSRQAMSIAMQLPLYQNADGSLLFALYDEEMPKDYTWAVWSELQALANITKDKRFLDAAHLLAPHIPIELREKNGY